MLTCVMRRSGCVRYLHFPPDTLQRSPTPRSRTLAVLAEKERSVVVSGAGRRSRHHEPGWHKLPRGLWQGGLVGPAPRNTAMVLGGLAAVSRSVSSAAAARAAELKTRNKKLAIYMASVVTAVLGISYAAVPLYKVFCQVTGFGGTTQVADAEKALKMKPVEGGRVIRVTFDGGTADTMPWKFRPTQGDVKVVPGETALAFFTAKNPTKKHITGVATYNVFPLKAGIYFNKIQCFCFEEQRLRAGEEIDMPVFFFLDPEMLDDPTMDSVNNVTLSYTFFQTAEEDPVEEDEEEDEEEEKGRGGMVVAAS